jgi:PEP-CTERM motif
MRTGIRKFPPLPQLLTLATLGWLLTAQPCKALVVMPVGGAPPVGVDANGAFIFDLNVGPTMTFIDPVVAVGYEYSAGTGNPNFRAVLLPSIGDDQYTLSYGTSVVPLAANMRFDFGETGVNFFTVTGIETSAGLDPNNPQAFVTGLEWVTEGKFTGTMKPLVADVPEPSTAALLAGGLLLLGGATWNRRRNQGAQLPGGRD